LNVIERYVEDIERERQVYITKAVFHGMSKLIQKGTRLYLHKDDYLYDSIGNRVTGITSGNACKYVRLLPRELNDKILYIVNDYSIRGMNNDVVVNNDILYLNKEDGYVYSSVSNRKIFHSDSAYMYNVTMVI
jgi:hypothetical protein